MDTYSFLMGFIAGAMAMSIVAALVALVLIGRAEPRLW